MPAFLLMLAFLAASVSTAQVTRDAPSYSAATIVNAASNDANSLAPYSIIRINGANLAWRARAMQSSDVRDGTVPTALPATGVHVFVGNQWAGILNVNPTQITALLPGDLLPGPVLVRVLLDGLAGPPVIVNLMPYGPGVFTNDDGTPILAHEDGSLVTPDAPLKPGEKVVIHATGLGPSDPPLSGLEIPTSALSLDPLTTVIVYLNGQPIDPALSGKPSLVPGQAGVYQLTILLPPDVAANPELQIEVNGIKSQAGLVIPIQSGNVPPTSSSKPLRWL